MVDRQSVSSATGHGASLIAGQSAGSAAGHSQSVSSVAARETSVLLVEMETQRQF